MRNRIQVLGTTGKASMIPNDPHGRFSGSYGKNSAHSLLILFSFSLANLKSSNLSSGFSKLARNYSTMPFTVKVKRPHRIGLLGVLRAGKILTKIIFILGHLSIVVQIEIQALNFGLSLNSVILLLVNFTTFGAFSLVIF